MSTTKKKLSLSISRALVVQGAAVGALSMGCLLNPFEPEIAVNPAPVDPPDWGPTVNPGPPDMPDMPVEPADWGPVVNPGPPDMSPDADAADQQEDLPPIIVNPGPVDMAPPADMAPDQEEDMPPIIVNPGPPDMG